MIVLVLFKVGHQILSNIREGVKNTHTKLRTGPETGGQPPATKIFFLREKDAACSETENMYFGKYVHLDLLYVLDYSGSATFRGFFLRLP